MKNTAVSRYLHVEGQIRLKAVLPVDLETEEAYVELLRLCFVEDPENRRRPAKTHGRTSLRLRLLDDLIRAEQKRSWDGHSERLGRPGVDDHVELDRLLHGQVARRGAPEDSVDVDAGHAIHLRNASAVEHQTARLHELEAGIHRDESMLGRKLDDRHAV